MRRIYRTEVHAAHCIPGHESCGQIHGHAYQIEVKLSSVPHYDFVDFHDIRKFCEEIINEFDHRNISEPLIHEDGITIPAINTAEQLTEYLHEGITIAWEEYLSNRRPGKAHAAHVEIQVFETSKFGAELS